MLHQAQRPNKPETAQVTFKARNMQRAHHNFFWLSLDAHVVLRNFWISIVKHLEFERKYQCFDCFQIYCLWPLSLLEYFFLADAAHAICAFALISNEEFEKSIGQIRN